LYAGSRIMTSAGAVEMILPSTVRAGKIASYFACGLMRNV
jgi:hypothetical protein